MTAFPAFRTYFGLGPKELPMAARIEINNLASPLAGNGDPGTFGFDLHDLGESQKLTTVQAVYIDNVANADPFKLHSQGHETYVYCPAYSYGMFPLFSLQKMRFTASWNWQFIVTSASAKLWMLNTPQPYFVCAVL